jgi:peptidoglycan/xylan/chitin deacetylase (PgdA/CDA1 family)
VVALGYHRIGDSAGSLFDHGLWSATPEGFDWQVRFLKKHFDVIGPGDLAPALARGRGRFALLTFDDGYRDNYTLAFPILKRHGVGATFFVSTGFLDQPHIAWWDEIAWMVRTSRRGSIPAGPWLSGPVAFDEPGRHQAIRLLLRKYKSLPGNEVNSFVDYLADETGSGRFPNGDIGETWMTWDMVREMRAEGMWFGGHTVNHPILARLPREQQHWEIGECKKRLEAELGEPIISFSYPVGGLHGFNADTRQCLQEEGVPLAFSYYGGFRRFDPWDAYDIRRIPVEQDTNSSLFRAKMTLPQFFA